MFRRSVNPDASPNRARSSGTHVLGRRCPGSGRWRAGNGYVLNSTMLSNRRHYFCLSVEGLLCTNSTASTVTVAWGPPTETGTLMRPIQHTMMQHLITHFAAGGPPGYRVDVAPALYASDDPNTFGSAMVATASVSAINPCNFAATIEFSTTFTTRLSQVPASAAFSTRFARCNATVTGLLANTSYAARVTALNMVGASLASDAPALAATGQRLAYAICSTAPPSVPVRSHSG
jgi:hypothetical protein